ncbi:DNA-binding transcriptional regulator LsrR (DeoR family) [Roseiarcus fermentans]|uniref:DNA-binding transcriptional regulator LsrR (DeoR family) n=1 Tax=Roseiarcus fermentans TaxID=1473586 RepID=A0A366FRG3_9HYPH|nr:sugar-binding transcriptional regulator [Roseiarcus fermentans]RBP17264.1 DNA-binding transcriptional regulator LsrR (DeoR family) [Roseiarcus fermentans]
MTSDLATAKDERVLPQRSASVLANVAILYYKDGLTQGEIAKRIGVSRATVVNYLRQAREQAIVDIRINGASFSVSKLSKDLREAYRLEDVYIASVYPGPDVNPEKLARDVRRQVARVGAMAVYDLVQPGDVLGVAWGETIQWLSEEMPRGNVRNLTICQMIGSMKSPLLPAAETSSIRIASSLGADCYTLHAPAILSSREIAEALKNEPIIHTQLQKLGELTKTLFSVGNCSETTHLVQSGIVDAEELHAYRRQGAVGVICGRFIDVHGRHVVGEMDARMIGVTPEGIKAASCGVMVASGVDKIEAIKAALAGGYANYLVTDETTGKLLLDKA